MRFVRRLAFGLLALAIVGFLLIQAVPYGRAHGNPTVTGEPAWDSPRTRELAKRACFACHSNETDWPWYSHVAPLSWWIQDHVDSGREELNFSTWNSGEDADDVYESVAEGEMPPWYYPLFDRLSDAERTELLRGLGATFPGDGGSTEREGGEHNENGRGDGD